MQVPLDAQFLHDMASFSLRFTCDDCLYFLRQRDEQTCAHEWPTEEHRLPMTETVVFCKEFELL